MRRLPTSAHVDAPLDDDRTLLALRLMTLGRVFDRRGISLQRQGKVGTYGPIRGQEAVAVGAALALDPACDWIVPSYRELPALVHHGVTLEQYWLFVMLHPQCWALNDGVKVFPIQIELGAQLPHAVGLAWGMRLQQSRGVVAAFFGDGASSEGDFYEAANLAGVTSAPVVFICLNNGWAISMPRSAQTRAETIAGKAAAFGFPGVAVDGNDVLAVHAAVSEAVHRARDGGGPTLIEAITYRVDGHNTSDDPTRYSDPSETARWEASDPIERLLERVEANGTWDRTRQADLEASLLEHIDAAYESAEARARVRTPRLLFDHVFADLPPRLHAQLARLEQEVDGAP